MVDTHFGTDTEIHMVLHSEENILIYFLRKRQWIQWYQKRNILVCILHSVYTTRQRFRPEAKLFGDVQFMDVM